MNEINHSPTKKTGTHKHKLSDFFLLLCRNKGKDAGVVDRAALEMR